jgi:demethylmenaquinone methyltransferase/2-methoxy-6-polyprenyl-1,4-benzoquinol methylase
MRFEQQISACLKFAVACGAVLVVSGSGRVLFASEQTPGAPAPSSQTVAAPAPAQQGATPVPGPELQLSADEAVKLALENNLGIRAERLSPAASFVAGDMMALPFASAHFDTVTTGYGLRNVPELAPAIAEIHRVLKPGGVFLSLDFNRPENPFVRAGYLAYLTVVGSALGLALHRDPDTYRYIPASVRRYPGATRVTGMLREQGFSAAESIPVLGGLMAIHRATK